MDTPPFSIVQIIVSRDSLIPDLSEVRWL